MHYYQFNIGDYRKDTNHLTLLEHGIYRNLLDTYYLNEKPLCEDDADLMRTHCVRTEEERIAFKNVIADFFKKTKKGYIHKRCDEQIAKYNQKSEKARLSAKSRWDAKAMRTHSEGNANHKPITINHKPNNNIVASAPKFNFKAQLISLGVNESTARDWLEVRKKKKAANTETALNGLIKQISESGLTPQKAIEMATEQSWAGFKAKWVANNDQDFSDTNTDWAGKDWGLI